MLVLVVLRRLLRDQRGAIPVFVARSSACAGSDNDIVRTSFRILVQTNSNGLTTVANGIGFSQSVTVTGGLSVGGEVTVTSGATTAVGSISVTSAHATNSPLMAFANSVYTGNLLYARLGSVTSANAIVCMEGNNLLFKVRLSFK